MGLISRVFAFLFGRKSEDFYWDMDVSGAPIRVYTHDRGESGWRDDDH